MRRQGSLQGGVRRFRKLVAGTEVTQWRVGATCAGASVVVGTGGTVSFTLAANQAVAVEVGGRS